MIKIPKKEEWIMIVIVCFVLNKLGGILLSGLSYHKIVCPRWEKTLFESWLWLFALKQETTR